MIVSAKYDPHYVRTLKIFKLSESIISTWNVRR